MPAPRERGPTLEIGRPPQHCVLGRAQFDDADNTELQRSSQASPLSYLRHALGAFVTLGMIAERVVGLLFVEDGQ